MNITTNKVITGILGLCHLKIGFVLFSCFNKDSEFSYRLVSVLNKEREDCGNLTVQRLDSWSRLQTASIRKLSDCSKAQVQDFTELFIQEVDRRNFKMAEE